MEPVPKQTPSSAFADEISQQTELTQLVDELDYLELLLPEIAPHSTREIQKYALAYIERYPDDILQLEQAWKLLYAALIQSCQQSDYASVVRLTQSLTYIVGRLNNVAIAEQILRLGVAACQQLQDDKHLAAFQNRLGSLLFSHGNYQEGRHLWYMSLRQAETTGCIPCLWEPFSSFTHIADILCSYPEAQQFVETIQHLPDHESSACFLVAVFIRGFRARVANHLSEAYHDFKYSLQLLSRYNTNTSSPFYRQLFTMAAHTELARVQGDYARSQAYAETSHSLAHLFGDHYTAASLLIDQMFFTYKQERFADAQAAFSRLCTLASQYDDPHFIRYCHILEQQLAAQFPKHAGYERLTLPAIASTSMQEALSEREVEVLHLLAAGLSNQQIARHLVITTATVKKHLEHAYAKLHVRSRTAAIARARSLSILS